jgi:hypothetical protein
MEAKPAQERADQVVIAFSFRPNPLKAFRELSFVGMGIMPEHNVLLTHIDTERAEKILAKSIPKARLVQRAMIASPVGSL